MSFLPLVAAVIAAVVLYLFVEKRASGALQQQLRALHEHRARFWRKMLQADEADEENAVRLRAEADQHCLQVEAIRERLKHGFREDAAGVSALTGAFEQELAEMRRAMSGGAWDRPLARDWARLASREAMRSAQGGRLDYRSIARNGALGAAIFALLPYLLLSNEGSALRFNVTLSSALLGVAVGVLGADWFFDHLVPSGQLRGEAFRNLLGTGAAAAFLFVMYLAVGGQPSPAQKHAVLERLAQRQACPRAVPRVESAVVGLSDREMCGLVWTAASALPREIQSSELGTVTVRSVTEEAAGMRRGFGLGSRRSRRYTPARWKLAIVAGNTSYEVTVDQTSGRALLHLF